MIEVGRVKRTESPSVQGLQYSEDDLIMRQRDTRVLIVHQSESIEQIV